MKKHVLTAMLGVLVLVGNAAALAEFSANIGVTSNYVWRGVTQTQDGPAVQGGVDYRPSAGLYLGAWTSNVDYGLGSDAGYELDLYGGYTGKWGDVDYDLGYIAYRYPQAGDDNFGEAYFGVSEGAFGVTVWYDQDNKNRYTQLSLDFGSGPRLGVKLHVGSYRFDEGEDYLDYGIALSKDGFALNVTHTDIDGADPRVFVSWQVDL